MHFFLKAERTDRKKNDSNSMKIVSQALTPELLFWAISLFECEDNSDKTAKLHSWEQCFHHARTKAVLLVSGWTCLHSYIVLVFLTSFCQLRESTKEQRTTACLCMDTAGARHFCGWYEYMHVSFGWKKKKTTSFVIL